MEMIFLLNNSLGVLQNKHSSYLSIALVGISLKMVFLNKFELTKMAPNSVKTHLKVVRVHQELLSQPLRNSITHNPLDSGYRLAVYSANSEITDEMPH